MTEPRKALRSGGPFGLEDWTWGDMLRRARQHPETRLGDAERAHVSCGIERPVRQCLVTRAVNRVERVRVCVGSTGALVVAEGGAMHEIIAPHLRLEDTDCLLGELMRASTELLDDRDPKMARRFRANSGLHGGGNSMMLAAWSAFGVRVDNRLWLQSYVAGWPVTPVASLEASGIGLIQGISFGTPYFTGLPFRSEDLTDALWPEFSRYRSRIDVVEKPLRLDDPTPPPWIFDPEQVLAELLRNA